MLLIEPGERPASIHADVLCSLTDASILLSLSLFCSLLTALVLWASDVWFSASAGAGGGFAWARNRFWEHALSIWPCRRLGFMFATGDDMGKQIKIHRPSRCAVCSVGIPKDETELKREVISLSLLQVLVM